MEKIVENFSQDTLEESHLIRIGCDGSSKGNPGAGGYGWYHNINQYGFGGSLKATNNAIELEALRRMKNFCFLMLQLLGLEF